MTSIREEAARWFVRLRHAAADHPDRGRFEAWLSASPSHAAAYAGFLELWEDFDSPRRAGALAGALERKRAERRQLLKRGALGLLVVAGGGSALWRTVSWIGSQPLSQVAFETRPGQVLRQSLPDGSRLAINAGSALSVAYFRSRREVALARGEAVFEVARDPQRPFIVDTGLARVTVLGTRFAVTREEDRVRVSVKHGRVQVEGVDARPSGRLALERGEAAEVTATGGPRRIRTASVDPFSWEHGTLVFDNATLPEIAAALSRYRAHPVRAQASASRVTAVVQIAELESFLQSLHAVAPVRLERDGEEILIVPR